MARTKDRELCIYCSATIQRARRGGDHVIPLALGAFRGDVRFTRVCRECNSNIGKSEQHLLSRGPEAYFRDHIRPAVPSSRPRKAGRGKNESIAWLDGHPHLVIQSTGTPGKCFPVDGIIFCESSGRPIESIRLHPNMRPDQLRKMANKNKLPADCYAHLACDSERLESYRSLISQAFPKGRSEKSATTEAGNRSVTVRVGFEVDTRYFQALAKIGFHYYLVHNQRGILGNEPQFALVRNFIMRGGDPDLFVKQRPGQFEMPFRNLTNGLTFAPDRWCHMLAADERERSITAYVQLFAGPEVVSPGVTVELGSIDSLIAVPTFAFGHLFVYDKAQKARGFAGSIEALEWEASGDQPLLALRRDLS